jgi:hypothetical protein
MPSLQTPKNPFIWMTLGRVSGNDSLSEDVSGHGFGHRMVRNNGKVTLETHARLVKVQYRDSYRYRKDKD